MVSNNADMSNPTSTVTRLFSAAAYAPSQLSARYDKQIGGGKNNRDLWRWRLSRVSANRSRILETVERLEMGRKLDKTAVCLTATS